MKKLKDYLKLMRIKHYIKNLMIFIPLFFAKKINATNIINLSIAFVSFSLMASVVYIINDLKDKEKDKLHHKKKDRPIASGRVKTKEAIILAALLFFISLVLNVFINFNIEAHVILVGYLELNLIYSLYLKKIPIADVCLLTAFYIIRIYFGGVVSGVSISYYLYLTIMCGALYLAFGKRKKELKKSTETRDVLKYYNYDFLDKYMNMSLTLTIVFYSLWAISQNIKYLELTIPLLFVLLMKYSLRVEMNEEGDPVDVILSDKVLIALGVIYAAAMFLIMR